MLIVASKQFSVAADGNLVVPVFIERHPLCDLLDPHCISVPILPCTFANSPSAKSTNSEGESANHTHSYNLFAADYTGTSITDSKQGKFLAAPFSADANKKFICAPNLSTEFHLGFSGGGSPHNNIQPIYGVYKFRRLT